MDDPRRELADKVAAAWAKYESAVRCGGTPVERQRAFDRAVKADDKLATVDWSRRSERQREMAARALSGA